MHLKKSATKKFHNSTVNCKFYSFLEKLQHIYIRKSLILKKTAIEKNSYFDSKSQILLI